MEKTTQRSIFKKQDNFWGEGLRFSFLKPTKSINMVTLRNKEAFSQKNLGFFSELKELDERRDLGKVLGQVSGRSRKKAL